MNVDGVRKLVGMVGGERGRDVVVAFGHEAVGDDSRCCGDGDRVVAGDGVSHGKLGDFGGLVECVQFDEDAGGDVVGVGVEPCQRWSIVVGGDVCSGTQAMQQLRGQIGPCQPW